MEEEGKEVDTELDDCLDKKISQTVASIYEQAEKAKDLEIDLRLFLGKGDIGPASDNAHRIRKHYETLIVLAREHKTLCWVKKEREYRRNKAKKKA